MISESLGNLKFDVTLAHGDKRNRSNYVCSGIVNYEHRKHSARTSKISSVPITHEPIDNNIERT